MVVARFAILPLIAFALIIEEPTPVPSSFELISLNNGDYPEALCNDGTTGAYYWAPGTSDSWIVFLQGGMWCWDEPSCASRWKNSPQLMSSSHWEPYRNMTGIFDNNPELTPLADANKVYIPYCSSDAWMGDRAASSETFDWHFRGQKVVEGVLHTLQAHHGLGKKPQTLVFSGCSAGGRGAMVNLDYVMGILAAGTTGNTNINLLGVLDSPLWVDVPPYTDKAANLANTTQQVYELANAEGRVADSKCGEVYTAPEDRWKCLFGQYKLPLITTPFLVNAAQYDAFQVTHNLDTNLPVHDWNQEMHAYVEILHDDIKKVAESLSNNVISTACYHHCTSEETWYWNVTTQGTSFSDATRILLKQTDEDNKWLGNCTTGINCGDGCNPINKPW